MRQSHLVTSFRPIHTPARGTIVGWSARRALLCLRVAALLALAAPAQAAVLEFVSMQQDGQGGVSRLAEPESVAMSPDGHHVYAGSSLDDAVGVFARDGATGALTFVHEVWDGGAGGVDGLNRVRAVAVSPDGAHVYAAGFTDKAVAVFRRNGTTGALTYAQVYKDGTGGITTLDGAHGIALSPNGAHVYVVSAVDNAVTVFARDATTGLLALVEAKVEGAGGITSLLGAETVAVSPDGAHVYVAAMGDGALTVFGRNATTGALTLVEAQRAGPGVDGVEAVQGVTVSPDGAHVLAVSGVDNAVVVFARNPATGALTSIALHRDGIGGVDGLAGAEWVTVNPNGRYVYVASDLDNALAVFLRNTSTGALTFLEAQRDGVGGANGLGGAIAVDVSPDGKHAYVVGFTDHSVAAYGHLCGNGMFNSGEECDDGNTAGGDCCSATCTNEPAGTLCSSDGNVCTDDKCNGVGLCLHVNNTAPCNDGNFCSVGDACRDRMCRAGAPRDCSGAFTDPCVTGVCDEGADACVAEPAADGEACDDGDACTQTDMCLAGLCTGTDPMICPAPEPCHTGGLCDPASGMCTASVLPDGSPCDDGNPCSQVDGCVAGVCAGGAPVVCAPVDQCHQAGACDPATGACSDPAVADGVDCDDGDACTQADACLAGACVGNDPVLCAAADPCHVAGVCDPATGVCSSPPAADGTPCDDGNGCTQTDACVAGLCVGAGAVVCTALDQCHTAGVCDPGTGLCSNPEAADGTTCSDTDPCTQTDTCVAGACVGANPAVCVASDACHLPGVCDPATGECSNPQADDGTACDDNDGCTRADACVAGACVGTDPMACAALDQCHTAGVCDPATGHCSEPAAPDGTACDDGDACTQADACLGGACVGSDPVICPPAASCREAGVCDPATGACSSADSADGAPCDDGNACTVMDMCLVGLCVGGEPVACPPADACRTAGACDPDTGTCSNLAAPDGTACDDGDACTQTDSCQAGACVGTDPVVCAALDQCHAAGACDAATGICSQPLAADGTACDDGNGCTRPDTCHDGVCVAGDPVVCAAIDGCHGGGVCDPATGACSSPTLADGTPCDDGDTCTQASTCVAGACAGSDAVVCTALDQCHAAGVCDPTTGVCSNPAAADGSACDDGDACTQADACQAGACAGSDEVVCRALDQCHTAGVCDPATGACSDPAAVDGSACDDGDACTQAAACQAGVCVGADRIVCVALDQCHTAGVCDPATGVCSDPAAVDGAECDDGDACTRLDRCVAGVCVGTDAVICAALDQCHAAGVCDPATGDCSHPAQPDGSGCDDGDPCTQTDTCDDGLCLGSSVVVCAALDDCHEPGMCDPATGACSDAVVADGTPCDDSDACTRADTCQAGMCVGTDPIVCAALDQCHAAGVCDPATGVCSEPLAADGTSCDDGDACTRTDACAGGVCVGADPVVCDSVDQCLMIGVCDPATGLCSMMQVDDGAPCEDGDGCTRNDTCQDNVCVPGALVTCHALDQCHAPGACDPGTGACTNPLLADGTVCDDGDACTRLDACVAGVCAGTDPVTCTALDQCHVAGACNPATGVCADPPAPDGRGCDDGNACTLTDGCAAGLCVGANPLVCGAPEQCHAVGTCDPATGDCSHPAQPDGTGCDVGDGCTRTDTCQDGHCVGADAVLCEALDACREVGVCDPATGMCSSPPSPDGMVLTFAADADAYTDGGAPLTAFGTAASLRLDGDPERRIYLRFDVAGIDGMSVARATIRLHTEADNNAGSSHGGHMHRVSDSGWDEASVTDASRPPIDGALLSSAGAVEPAQSVDFDVTAAIAGDGLYSFGVEPGSTNLALYVSREAGSGGPELVVVLGTTCDDGDVCTRLDLCREGACIGTDAVACAALDPCHDAGTCDPTTGACSDPPAADGTLCDDGNPCTDADACVAGICTGTPVLCAALDPCHAPGVCDPATGECSSPAAADGTPCDDASACTQDDVCVGGACVGTDPVTCAAGRCHTAGVCDPATGLCSTPPVADGTACDDGAFCTVDDACEGGVCLGTPRDCSGAGDQCIVGVCDDSVDACLGQPKANGVTCDDGAFCTVGDVCREGRCEGVRRDCAAVGGQCEVGTCDEGANACRVRARADGASCDDGNACTRTDSCRAGVCAGTNPVTCAAPDQCHDAGRCTPATGECSSRAKADGGPCDDGDACSEADACSAGQCRGRVLPDGDGDGFCDAVDLCPGISDPAQGDTDGDGVGDVCQCTSPAPGRCIAGGGSKRTDCLLELTSGGPLTFNRRGTKIRSGLRCADGDPACDLDGARDGQCTFGVALCFANDDPRYPRCQPSPIGSAEVLRPSAVRGTPISLANGQRLETALATLGVEVRRRGRVIADANTTIGGNRCTATVTLHVAAPAGGAGRTVTQKFDLAAQATNGRKDKDTFALQCE